jgi:hypothetical protein
MTIARGTYVVLARNSVKDLNTETKWIVKYPPEGKTTWSYLYVWAKRVNFDLQIFTQIWIISKKKTKQKAAYKQIIFGHIENLWSDFFLWSWTSHPTHLQCTIFANAVEERQD